MTTKAMLGGGHRAAHECIRETETVLSPAPHQGPPEEHHENMSSQERGLTREVLTFDGRKHTVRKNRMLTYAVLAIAGLLLTSSDVWAGLVNQDTGEVYIPTMDEDGNMEEPPDWVPQVEHSEVAVFQSEVVVNEDYCWSAVDEWLGNGDGEVVSEAMTDPDTGDELLATIQGWIRAEIADQQENLPDDVTLGVASLTRLCLPQLHVHLHRLPAGWRRLGDLQENVSKAADRCPLLPHTLGTRIRFAGF